MCVSGCANLLRGTFKLTCVSSGCVLSVCVCVYVCVCVCVCVCGQISHMYLERYA